MNKGERALRDGLEFFRGQEEALEVLYLGGPLTDILWFWDPFQPDYEHPEVVEFDFSRVVV